MGFSLRSLMGAFSGLSTTIPTAGPSPTMIRLVGSFGQVRYATHMSEGRANGAKNGPGKRLGPKKGDGEYVVAGNILFRQRGTLWFAGENCSIGRDQTIHAAENGFVRYYRDPERHPTRKFIGVVFDRDGRLPRLNGEPRIRRLGLDVVQPGMENVEMVEKKDVDVAQYRPFREVEKVKPAHRRDLVAREPNYLIGRLKNSTAALPIAGKKTKVRSIAHLAQSGKKTKKVNKGKNAGKQAGAGKSKR